MKQGEGSVAWLTFILCRLDLAPEAAQDGLVFDSTHSIQSKMDSFDQQAAHEISNTTTQFYHHLVATERQDTNFPRMYRPNWTTL